MPVILIKIECSVCLRSWKASTQRKTEWTILIFERLPAQLSKKHLLQGQMQVGRLRAGSGHPLKLRLPGLKNGNVAPDGTCRCGSSVARATTIADVSPWQCCSNQKDVAWFIVLTCMTSGPEPECAVLLHLLSAFSGCNMYPATCKVRTSSRICKMSVQEPPEAQYHIGLHIEFRR